MNVIVIAGHFNASTGPCAMVIVPDAASTDSTLPVAEAMVPAAAGISAMGAGAGAASVDAVGRAGDTGSAVLAASLCGDEQAASNRATDKVATVFMAVLLWVEMDAFGSMRVSLGA